MAAKQGTETPAFEFITLTSEPSSHKNEYSYTIRSHAMQSFLHQKKHVKPAGKTGSEPVSNIDAEVKTSKQLSGRFKLATWSRKSRRKVVNNVPVENEVSKGPRIEGSSDFEQNENPPISQALQLHENGFPISTNSPKTRELISHYNNSFHSNGFALNLNDNLKSFSITDPALLHATLCFTAQHRDLLQGVQDSREGLWHKGEVMRLMNLRLCEEGRLVSDADITSVALLVTIESINGTFEAASAHRRGLRKMIDIRGGYEIFAQDPVVLRVLAWSDIVHSTRFDPPLLFPSLFYTSDALSSLLDHQSNPWNPAPSMFPGDPKTASLLRTLRILNTAAGLPTLNIAQKSATADLLYDVETRILESEHNFIPFSLGSNGSGIETPILAQAFAIATLLYLHLAIRELPIQRSPLHDRLVSKLASLLLSISRYQLSSIESVDVLLWCVFVAIAVCRDKNATIQLMLLIQSSQPSMDFVSKDGIRERKRHVVWREEICDPIFDGIWGTIEKVKNGTLFM